MQLVNGAFQFAFVDITNGLNVDIVLRLFLKVITCNQFEVRSIPTIEMNLDLVM